MVKSRKLSIKVHIQWKLYNRGHLRQMKKTNANCHYPTQTLKGIFVIFTKSTTFIYPAFSLLTSRAPTDGRC